MKTTQSPLAATVLVTLAVLSPRGAVAAEAPTPGSWECGTMSADSLAEVRVRGDEVLVYRAMYPTFEGTTYKLEHLFRGTLRDGKLTGRLTVRDDPKDPFADLRAFEGEVKSAGEMTVDGLPMTLVEGGAGKAVVAELDGEPVKGAAPPPPGPPGGSVVAAVPTAPTASGAALGYFSQLVRGASTAGDLFALQAGIAVSKDGQAALDAGERAFEAKSWGSAVAAWEKALASGVPVSRFAARAVRAYLGLKDCGHAEGMLARVTRLDPEGGETAALLTSLAKACPKSAPRTVAPLRLDPAAVKKLAAELDARPAGPVDARLAKPRSYDEVAEVLRLDQVSLFPAAVEFIATLSDVRAQALRAQLELAWAEALQLLAEIDANLVGRFREEAARFEARAAADGLSADEFKALGAMRASAFEMQQTAEALRLAAADHLARGLEVARAVIKKSPSDYLGYRVAADSYRLQRDWKSFAAMVAKLEKTNPGSIGLLFLKGVAAAQRDHDAAAAAKFLRAALVRDPKFARAQAHLMMLQPTLDETWAEFQKLKAISPSHPIVTWTGTALEKLVAEQTR